jgi:hypothetical protein
MLYIEWYLVDASIYESMWQCDKFCSTKVYPNSSTLEIVRVPPSSSVATSFPHPIHHTSSTMSRDHLRPYNLNVKYLSAPLPPSPSPSLPEMQITKVPSLISWKMWWEIYFSPPPPPPPAQLLPLAMVVVWVMMGEWRSRADREGLQDSSVQTSNRNGDRLSHRESVFRIHRGRYTSSHLIMQCKYTPSFLPFCHNHSFWDIIDLGNCVDPHGWVVLYIPTLCWHFLRKNCTIPPSANTPQGRTALSHDSLLNVVRCVAEC